MRVNHFIPTKSGEQGRGKGEIDTPLHRTSRSEHALCMQLDQVPPSLAPCSAAQAQWARAGKGLEELRFPFPPAAEVKLISITSVAEKEGKECQDRQEAWGGGGRSPFIFPQGL